MSNPISHNLFPSRPKILFMGTPQFAVPTLQALIREKYRILSVVSQPDRPKGRGRRLTPSPVTICARENNLPILRPQRLDDGFLDRMLTLKPDLLIVVAFGQIIPGTVLSSARWGGINIHASLLPQYRGSAPIQWAVINNERTTGLTTMFMDEDMDTGPIILQEKVDIGEDETAGMLHDRLSFLAPGLLLRTLEGLADGSIAEREQDHDLATYAPRLTKEQGLIDWSLPAERLYGLIRGLDPWPGAFTYYHEKMLKLFGCTLAGDRQPRSLPGRVTGFFEQGLEIATGKGSIMVKEVQAPGKKRMPFKEFKKGSALSIGDMLGK